MRIPYVLHSARPAPPSPNWGDLGWLSMKVGLSCLWRGTPRFPRCPSKHREQAAASGAFKLPEHLPVASVQVSQAVSTLLPEVMSICHNKAAASTATFCHNTDLLWCGATKGSNVYWWLTICATIKNVMVAQMGHQVTSISTLICVCQIFDWSVHISITKQ